MLIATSTTNSVFSQFGTVSSSIFSSFQGWLFLIAGLMVAWFVIESIKLVFFSDIMKRNRELDERAEQKTKDMIERGNKMSAVIKKYDK